MGVNFILMTMLDLLRRFAKLPHVAARHGRLRVQHDRSRGSMEAVIIHWGERRFYITISERERDLSVGEFEKMMRGVKR